MSPCRRPATYIFREDGNEPVVTCGSAPLALRATIGRGAESGMLGLRLKTRIGSDVGNWYSPASSSVGRSYPYAGTTRIRFEGFPRPANFPGQRYLSPFAGAPLGLRDYSQCAPPPSSGVGAGRAGGEAVGTPSWSESGSTSALSPG